MRHSCLASHLSSEPAPLLGMGNVKPSPGICFVFKHYHSYSLAVPRSSLSIAVQESSDGHRSGTDCI